MPLNILVINLTRMGDLVQTFPLVQSLKASHPDSHLCFLALSSFAPVLTLCPDIDEVFTWDAGLLFKGLEGDYRPAAAYLEQQIALLNQRNFDLILNPVVAAESAILAGQIKAGQVLGMVHTKNQERIFTSLWSAYHIASQRRLGGHDFNIADIFCQTAGPGTGTGHLYSSVPAPARQAANEWFNSQLEPGIPVVGIHLGASQGNKTWPAESFAQLITLLLEQKIYILLFGGWNEVATDSPLNNLQHPRFFNLSGRFDLPTLTAFLARCNLLISNDTGPMHLAASQNTPVLNISLGPVSHWETGPYRPGSMVITANLPCHPCPFNHRCSHRDCHRLVSPQTVASTALAMLNPGLNLPSDMHVKMWQGVRDLYGLMHWLPPVPRPISPEEMQREATRLLWAVLLTGHSVGSAYPEYLARGYTGVKLPDQYVENMLTVAKLCRQLAEVYTRMGTGPASELKPGLNRARMIRNELDSLAERVYQGRDILFWVNLVENSWLDNDPHILSRNTGELFRLLARAWQTAELWRNNADSL